VTHEICILARHQVEARDVTAGAQLRRGSRKVRTRQRSGASGFVETEPPAGRRFDDEVDTPGKRRAGDGNRS
jgi:hypothetical protein